MELPTWSLLPGSPIAWRWEREWEPDEGGHLTSAKKWRAARRLDLSDKELYVKDRLGNSPQSCTVKKIIKSVCCKVILVRVGSKKGKAL